MGVISNINTCTCTRHLNISEQCLQCTNNHLPVMTYLMLLFITVDKEKVNQIFVYNNVLSQDKKDCFSNIFFRIYKTSTIYTRAVT